MSDENQFHNDSIYWIELDKVHPNPYQPRREFNEVKINELADSIRQYGVLQPLVVTRKEFQTEEGGLDTSYELIAGERRLRASQIAGLSQIPVIIKRIEGNEEENNRLKLELAIIENLQREDLNAMDRAYAFSRLVEEFNFKHVEVGKKVGKSREYVSNTIRLLLLPEEAQQALAEGKISEGHSRPVLMLNGKPEEQMTLFKEIIAKKLTVREAEAISRRVAVDKVRKQSLKFDPEMVELENQLTETLGTRVQIEKRQVGGKLTIDFFSADDLRGILDVLNKEEGAKGQEEVERFINTDEEQSSDEQVPTNPPAGEDVVLDERSENEKEEEIEDEDLYSIKNFSL
jgi:ParB family transcriptional regulator, chromosome partitioning protein